MSERPNRSQPIGTWLGLALVLAGFTVIYVAWEGASELNYVQGQFPYLISGGLTGLGLVGVGVMILLVEVLRRDAARRAAELQRIGRAVSELRALLAPVDAYDPSVTGEFQPRPRGEEDEDDSERVIETTARWERS